MGGEVFDPPVAAINVIDFQAVSPEATVAVRIESVADAT